mmetsp:Transcript_33895/g.89834  ORF Transcript_33895/g.89834 Transcript_33895/m.89834 type:complete len:223 (+) Transcript_33895:827-1495(+)
MAPFPATVSCAALSASAEPSKARLLGPPLVFGKRMEKSSCRFSWQKRLETVMNLQRLMAPRRRSTGSLRIPGSRRHEKRRGFTRSRKLRAPYKRPFSTRSAKASFSRSSRPAMPMLVASVTSSSSFAAPFLPFLPFLKSFLFPAALLIFSSPACSWKTPSRFAMDHSSTSEKVPSLSICSRVLRFRLRRAAALLPVSPFSSSSSSGSSADVGAFSIERTAAW